LKDSDWENLIKSFKIGKRLRVTFCRNSCSTRGAYSGFSVIGPYSTTRIGTTLNDDISEICVAKYENEVDPRVQLFADSDFEASPDLAGRWLTGYYFGSSGNFLVGDYRSSDLGNGFVNPDEYVGTSAIVVPRGL